MRKRLFCKNDWIRLRKVILLLLQLEPAIHQTRCIKSLLQPLKTFFQMIKNLYHDQILCPWVYILKSIKFKKSFKAQFWKELSTLVNLRPIKGRTECPEGYTRWPADLTCHPQVTKTQIPTQKSIFCDTQKNLQGPCGPGQVVNPQSTGPACLTPEVGGGQKYPKARLVS